MKLAARILHWQESEATFDTQADSPNIYRYPKKPGDDLNVSQGREHRVTSIKTTFACIALVTYTEPLKSLLKALQPSQKTTNPPEFSLLLLHPEGPQKYHTFPGKRFKAKTLSVRIPENLTALPRR